MKSNEEQRRALNSTGGPARTLALRDMVRYGQSMIPWRWLVGSVGAGALTALVALAIAALAGGAVSPLAGVALGLAFGMMASRLVPVGQAILLGLVAAVSATLTILLVQA